MSAQAYAGEINGEIQSILTRHYNQYKGIEYFSGISLAVSSPLVPTWRFYVGQTSHDQSGNPIGESTLFSIGSITKSFTAVLILQLEAEKKLKLSDSVRDHLPGYPKWGHLTIEQLLNMSSGLPNYTDSPTMNYVASKELEKQWTAEELLGIVYPRNETNPPLKPGYFYTNTGYLLSALIIEKITGMSFKAALESRLLIPLKLNNTFYPIPKSTQNVQERLAGGYAYNQYENPELVGQDIRNNNLSWARAAGAIVSNPADIIQWVDDVFIKDALLTKEEKQKMQKIISVKTGLPINRTTAEDPKGFGLGIIQNYNSDIGRFWYYQGETLGYRALYMFVPCNRIIIATAINSATNGENDHAGELLQSVYSAILNQYPDYRCKDQS